MARDAKYTESARWAGFAKTKGLAAGGPGDIRNTMSMDRPWAGTQEMLDFKISREMVEKDAKINANMWLRHPAYKMTLASAREGADADGDGLIDREEFKALLQASGYTGGAIQKIFATIDADGDGQVATTQHEPNATQQHTSPRRDASRCHTRTHFILNNNSPHTSSSRPSH